MKRDEVIKVGIEGFIFLLLPWSAKDIAQYWPYPWKFKSHVQTVQSMSKG